MTLKDFITDKDLATATDLFNAKAQSPEEMLIAYNKAVSERNAFSDICAKYCSVLIEVNKAMSNVSNAKDGLSRLQKFRESREAELMADYILNKNEDSLAQLNAMIATENTWDIRIVPAHKKRRRRKNVRNSLLCIFPYRLYR